MASLIDALGLVSARLISLVGAGGKTNLMFALAREFAAVGERVLVTTTTKIATSEAVGPWLSFGADSAANILRLADAAASPIIAYHHELASTSRLQGFDPAIIDELARDGTFGRILVEADGSARRPLKAPAAHEPVVPSATDAFIVVVGLNGLGQPLSEDSIFGSEIWQRLTGGTEGDPIAADAVVQAYLHPDGLTKGCPSGAARCLFLNRADNPDRVAAAQEIIRCLGEASDGRPDRAIYGYLLPATRIAGQKCFV